MLRDWGQQITVAGVTRNCLVDERDELGLEQQGAAAQVQRVIVATVKSADFPAIAHNDPVELGAKNYTVWRRVLLGDGALTELFLRRAPDS